MPLCRSPAVACEPAFKPRAFFCRCRFPSLPLSSSSCAPPRTRVAERPRACYRHVAAVGHHVATHVHTPWPAELLRLARDSAHADTPPSHRLAADLVLPRPRVPAVRRWPSCCCRCLEPRTQPTLADTLLPACEHEVLAEPAQTRSASLCSDHIHTSSKRGTSYLTFSLLPRHVRALVIHLRASLQCALLKPVELVGVQAKTLQAVALSACLCSRRPWVF